MINLDAQSRAALALVFMRGGALESPISLTEAEQEVLHLLGIDWPTAREALVAMDASLVSLVRSGGRSTWTFKHPTIGDAHASLVAGNPELLDIYLSWTNAGKLIHEVTCGDVGLQGVKVIVPQSRFERFLERLDEVKNRHMLLIFLASRCSPEFLKLYLNRHPNLGEDLVEPGSYLSASVKVNLLVKLHETGLFLEEWRVRFVKHAQVLALETPDVDFLSNSYIRALFTESELAGILKTLREELLPKFSSIVEDWQFNHDSDIDPEQEFAPLYEVLGVLRAEFEGDPTTEVFLTDAESEVDKAIQYLQEENRRPDEDVDYEYRGSSQSDGSDERSIFDDIDQ